MKQNKDLETARRYIWVILKTKAWTVYHDWNIVLKNIPAAPQMKTAAQHRMPLVNHLPYIVQTPQ